MRLAGNLNGFLDQQFGLRIDRDANVSVDDVGRHRQQPRLDAKLHGCSNRIADRRDIGIGDQHKIDPFCSQVRWQLLRSIEDGEAGKPRSAQLLVWRQQANHMNFRVK